MDMRDCPKWICCSAPVCPIDGVGTVHLSGEKICFYLSEYVKPNGRTILRGCIAEEHYQAIAKAYPEIIDTYAPIKKALRRAANTPSRLNSKIGGVDED